jgi:putative membrane protein
MSHIVSKLFSPEDLSRISNAVKEAESKTSGEIVPYIVDHSDAYEEAEWRCGSLLALLVLAGHALVQKFTSLWYSLDFLEIVAVALVAFGAGMALVKFLPGLKRFFAGHALLERRISQRAAEAFVTEEVFKTRERTGILLFISLLEHRVLIVGDSGINAKVQRSDWEQIAQTVVLGIRRGRTVDGLIEAIRGCGLLLEKHGVRISPDDTNELPDSLRMSDK